MTQYQEKPKVVDAVQWDGTAEGFGVLQAFGPVGMILTDTGFSVIMPRGFNQAYLLKDDWLCKDYYGGFFVVRGDDFNNLYQAV